MELTLEQIKSITLGAVDIWEEDGFIRFSRFYPAQLAMYQKENLDFYKKAQATAGIKLQFKTNSENISLRVFTVPGSSRQFFSIDVLADGKLAGAIKNLPDRYLGEFSGSIALGAGEKTVTVHLPWSVGAKIGAVCLDEGAYITPERPKKSLLIYGDSITQGYDAKQTSLRYAAKLAEFLDAQEHNRAIGGEVYNAKLAQLETDIKPDYVSIAYGSNDWSKKTQQEFWEQCRPFIKTVSERYPQAEIFVLTPIWRKDLDRETPFGDFADVEKILRRACEDLSNVKVIRGFDFVPHDESYYEDLYLHPNDEGFRHYTQNLHRELAKAMEK